MKRFNIIFSVLILSLGIAWPGIVYGLSSDQTRALNSGIYYFNTEDSSCSVAVSTSLNGNDSQQQAYNFFVKKSLTPSQSAAIVGNLMWESHLDPTATNSNGGAHGIAQWLGGRLDNLKSYAAQNNQPVDSLGLQLDFVWHELSGNMKNVLSDLKAVNTLQAANHVVFAEYEAPGDSTEPDRLKNATDIYNLYGSSPVSGTTGQSICSSSGTGQDTQYVDGFTVYSQYDHAWSSNKYGDTTIAAAGCGPSAMAMIITTITGNSVTPAVTAAYADQKGLYVPNKGSSWSIAKVLADHWGLKSTFIGADKAGISVALQTGALVIVAGKDVTPFTPYGHFIVIRAVTVDGQWLIGDSASKENSTKQWSPDIIMSGIQSDNASGSVYAISR